MPAALLLSGGTILSVMDAGERVGPMGNYDLTPLPNPSLIARQDAKAMKNFPLGQVSIYREDILRPILLAPDREIKINNWNEKMDQELNKIITMLGKDIFKGQYNLVQKKQMKELIKSVYKSEGEKKNKLIKR